MQTDSFITKVTSHAYYSNQTWPFVTIPNFSVEATKLLRLSKAFHMGMYHVVEVEQRNDWEEYADLHHKEWIKDSIEIQTNDPNYHGNDQNITLDYNTSYNIYGLMGENVTEPAPGKTNYLPAWQQAPTILQSEDLYPYNFDAWAHPPAAESIQYATSSQRVTIPPIYNQVQDPNNEFQILLSNVAADWAGPLTNPNEDPYEPLLLMTYPVINSVGTLQINVNEPQPIVAVVIFGIFWRELIRNILPSDSK